MFRSNNVPFCGEVQLTTGDRESIRSQLSLTQWPRNRTDVAINRNSSFFLSLLLACFFATIEIEVNFMDRQNAGTRWYIVAAMHLVKCPQISN